jgi:type IX secretion system PorP/SprF family membrane protein
MLKKLRISTVALLMLMIIATTLKAQDPEFSQFYANPMYTNPAFAGSECGRIALAYRMQYYGLPGGFVTFNGSYDQRSEKIHGGFGLMFTNDIAGEGVLTANHVNAVYAYELPTKLGITFRFGMQAGFFQKSLQWDKLRWGDEILPQLGFVLPTGETRAVANVIGANFSSGVLMYSNKFYLGFACHNITEPYQSFLSGPPGIGTSIPRRFTLHGGLMIPLDNKSDGESSFSPNILIMSQGMFSQVNVGFYLNRGPLVAGLWFRQTIPNKDALIVLIGFRQGDFKFGYSIDLTTSDLKGAGKTAHELTATYQFCHSKPTKPIWKEPKCPIF